MKGKNLKITFTFLASLLLNFFLSFFLFADELSLPEPVSNNAVAIAEVKGRLTLFSFNGLSAGKTYQDIHAKAFSIDLQTKQSKTIASLPDGKGRLASIAVTLNNRIFVMGGYTVAKDHSEVSTPEIFEYFPLEDKYQLVTKMPVPVDDTVALIYQQRYLYLISGWHDTGNVNLVQVYDTKKKRWFNATPFPGAAVFGHAGAIVNNQFLIADGVKVNRVVNDKREYGSSNENWIGEIGKNDPSIILWTKIQKHPFKPLYRMAAAGLTQSNQIIFVGGSDNPYNYNGTGYDGVPSKASSAVFSYDFSQSKWLVHQPLEQPSMDHRGLLVGKKQLYIVGGMGENQTVLKSVQTISLSKFVFNKEKQ